MNVSIFSNTTEWKVTRAPGLDCQPSKITFHNPPQKIPTPLGMKTTVEDYQKYLQVAHFLRLFSKYNTRNVLGYDSKLLDNMNQEKKHDVFLSS